MGVEAGRLALPARPTGYEPGAAGFATTAPAYADKTNATAIHAALGLADDVPALRRRRRRPLRRRRGVDGRRPPAASPCSSDVRTGRPGSADEADGGDGAVTLAVRRRRRHRRGRRRRRR